MHLKIPPFFVTLITVLLMYVLAYVLPFGNFVFTGQKYLMYLLLGLGSVIGFVSLVQFYAKKTTINPKKLNGASTLVISGLYKYSRNPMYLGILLFLLAWSLYLSNAFNILLVAGFVSYMNKFQITPEETALEKLFGKEYKFYKKSVRRWF
ncbi:isoprenylcysteine carboxylmethyltransferase family protein [Cellulophaga baltica]|uniref:methyltransferase family protein n=1 Tax=Cellulophaga TaxID=104264 RepID=UPI001C06DE72|nr:MULTISPECIES: isoprenylcysteine carboxylmethyltransferase family protein [Cellulophaga]MBU2997429.1 isoprenylcysteine carboxylmethyltransferase family protein [Cellulophaga baltica]MDO6768826.1 isoprenylcysteine carboxylmethyltransferase family protein [Cellulophaga sp. 1_MG-2023]